MKQRAFLVLIIFTFAYWSFGTRTSIALAAGAEDISRSTSLAQLHELEGLLSTIEDTVHDFDKGRVRSLAEIVLKVEEVIKKNDLVHLSVTNAYVFLITRFSYGKDFFRAVVTDENQYAISRMQQIILDIRKTRGLNEVPRLHVVEANLVQLKDALNQFRKLGIVDDEINSGLSKASALLLTAMAVASGGDSYLAYKSVHPLYEQITSMYPLFRKYYADQNTAIICGTIFEVNEALGKFSDADRAQ